MVNGPFKPQEPTAEQIREEVQRIREQRLREKIPFGEKAIFIKGTTRVREPRRRVTPAPKRVEITTPMMAEPPIVAPPPQVALMEPEIPSAAVPFGTVTGLGAAIQFEEMQRRAALVPFKERKKREEEARKELEETPFTARDIFLPSEKTPEFFAAKFGPEAGPAIRAAATFGETLGGTAITLVKEPREALFPITGMTIEAGRPEIGRETAEALARDPGRVGELAAFGTLLAGPAITKGVGRAVSLARRVEFGPGIPSRPGRLTGMARPRRPRLKTQLDLKKLQAASDTAFKARQAARTKKIIQVQTKKGLETRAVERKLQDFEKSILRRERREAKPRKTFVQREVFEEGIRRQRLKSAADAKFFRQTKFRPGQELRVGPRPRAERLITPPTQKEIELISRRPDFVPRGKKARKALRKERIRRETLETERLERLRLIEQEEMQVITEPFGKVPPLTPMTTLPFLVSAIDESQKELESQININNQLIGSAQKEAQSQAQEQQEAQAEALSVPVIPVGLTITEEGKLVRTPSPRLITGGEPFAPTRPDFLKEEPKRLPRTKRRKKPKKRKLLFPPFPFFGAEGDRITAFPEKKGYHAFVKDKGKVRRLTRNPRTLETALSVGGQFVDTTPVASFTVREAGKPAQGAEIDTFRFISDKFRPRRTRKALKLVEKSQFRIDSIGEVVGLQQARKGKEIDMRGIL